METRTHKDMQEREDIVENLRAVTPFTKSSRRRFSVKVDQDGTPAILGESEVLSEDVDFFRTRTATNDSGIQSGVYISSTENAEKEMSVIQVQWDGIKSKKTVDGTFSDQLLFGKKQSTHIPSPDGMEILSRWLGVQKEDVVIVNRAIPSLMANVFRYTIMKILEDGKSPWKFQDIESKIGQKSYSIPSGMQNMVVVQVAHEKTASAPSNPMIGMVSLGGVKVALICHTEYNNLSVALYAKTQLDAEDVLDYLMSMVNQYNFYKGGRIDGSGNFLDIPHTTWDQVIIDPEEKAKFDRNMASLEEKRDSFIASGFSPQCNFALVGELGTGKTMIVRVLATTYTDYTLIWVNPGSLGYGAQSIAEIYDLAEWAGPTIVFWEDVERYMGDQTMVTELMNRLSGMINLKNVITGFSSNNPQIVAGSIMNRAGRVDFVVYLGPCDASGRLRMLAQSLSKCSVAKEALEAASNSDKLKGMTPVQINEVARRSVVMAISMGRTDEKSKAAIVSLEDILSAADEFQDEVKYRLGNFLDKTVVDDDDNEKSNDSEPMTFDKLKQLGYGNPVGVPSSISDSAPTNELDVTPSSEHESMSHRLSASFKEALRPDIFLEAADPDRVKSVLSVALGDQFDIDKVYTDLLIDNERLQDAIEGILEDGPIVRLLRKNGVKSRSIRTAQKLADETDTSIEDIVIALTGKSI